MQPVRMRTGAVPDKGMMKQLHTLFIIDVITYPCIKLRVANLCISVYKGTLSSTIIYELIPRANSSY